MITIDSVITFSFGSIVGFIASELIKDRLARNRNIETLQITEFNKGAAAFRAAFVDTIFLLRRHKEGASSLIRKIITDSVIVEQEKAKILFEPFLSKTDLPAFNVAWDTYINSRLNYGDINSNPTKVEEGQFCLDHIDNLLAYAKPKT